MRGRTYRGVGRTKKVYVRPPFILNSWTSCELSFRIHITDKKLALHLALENFLSFHFKKNLKSVSQKGSDVHLKVPSFDFCGEIKKFPLLNVFLLFCKPYILATCTIPNYNNFKASISYKIISNLPS